MNWSTVKLGDVCKTTSGGTPKRDVAAYYNGDIPWVKSGELKDSLITKTGEHISKLGLDNSSAKLIPKGTLLIALYGATVGKLGMLHIEAASNQAVCAIYTSKAVHQKYLFHYLFKIRNKLIERSSGGAQPNISQDIIRNLEIPLPSLPEQKRIAEVLDKADALRGKRRLALQKLDTLLQSVFLEMFGDPVKNPKELGKVPLGKYVKVQGGFAFKSNDYLDDGVKLVKISNVNFETLTWDDINFLPNSYLDIYKDFALKDKDIVLSLTRPIIKSLNNVKIAQVSTNDLPCLLNQRVGRFVIKNSNYINENYLIHFCYSTHFKNEIIRYSSESLQPNVSPKQIEEVMITLPPIKEQQKFSRAVEQIQKIKKLAKSSLGYSETLFQSLQQRAFKGELFSDESLTVKPQEEKSWRQTSLS